MATTIVPTNPNTPTPPTVPGNVASLANPNTLSNLKNSISPKTFGDQIKDKAKQQVIKAATNSPLTKLYEKKANLIKEEIQLDIDHQKALAKLTTQHTPTKKIENGQTVEVPPRLTDQEYNAAVEAENKAYTEVKKNIQVRKEANQKSIDDVIKDPFKKQKDKKKQLDSKIDKDKVKGKAEGIKADIQRNTSALKSPNPPEKKIAIALSVILTTILIRLLQEQKEKLQDLVVKTNIIIDNATTKEEINKAILLKNKAVAIINSQQRKIENIRNILTTISLILEILSLLIVILTPLIILNPALKLIIDKVKTIIEAINSILVIIIPLLNLAIDDLNNLRDQLHDIFALVDVAAAATIPNINSSLTFGTSGNSGNGISGNSGIGASNNGNGNSFPDYRGFKFALKEDSGPNAVVVAGNKRHYAVAIDTNNVEVLKSELSFTLDPNDLIEQLKLIIDQQNLIA